MYKQAMKTLPWGREYANNGLHAQQVVAYTLLGVRMKADNKPFTAGGDVGTMQVKSARATICKGSDIRKHITLDGATCYGYVTKEFDTLYVMTPSEYADFVDRFAYATNDSNTARKSSNGHGGSNGGGVKLKLRTCAENKEMYKWLEERL